MAHMGICVACMSTYREYMLHIWPDREAGAIGNNIKVWDLGLGVQGLGFRL